MTIIDKIVHYLFLLLLGSVLKLVYFSLKVEDEEKSDTILHNFHPGPVDPYSQHDGFMYFTKHT